jgi:peptide/nickel transport system ATP-binding protein
MKGEMKWFRRKAQMIFQDPFMSLNPYMTVKQIIEEPLIIHNIEDQEERIFKALADVKLLPPEEFLPKYPHMLSGGQRQRVGIARSLVLEPSFLVADEPVSMIDASSRAEILFLIREIQKKYDVGIMYITHDIATAKYFSDNMAVMYAGKIIEQGPTDMLLKNPLHPYTIALVEAVPDPDPQNRFRFRKVVLGEPPNPINPPAGCRFHPRCPYAKEECERKEPKLREVSKRKVACHYAERFMK